jgi:hypothetical protein
MLRRSIYLGDHVRAREGRQIPVLEKGGWRALARLDAIEAARLKRETALGGAGDKRAG